MRLLARRVHRVVHAAMLSLYAIKVAPSTNSAENGVGDE